jgi:hypothetical protein
VQADAAFDASDLDHDKLPHILGDMMPSKEIITGLRPGFYTLAASS